MRLDGKKGEGEVKAPVVFTDLYRFEGYYFFVGI